MMDTRSDRLFQWLGLSLVLLGFVALEAVHAQPDKTSPVRKTAKEVTHPTEQVLIVNNSPVWIGANGEFGAIDPFSGDNDSYPAGASSHVTFAQGLMFGGKVRDERFSGDSIRVGGSTYDSGLSAGGIDWNPNTGEVNGAETGPDSEFHVWRVDRGWAQQGGGFSDVVRQSAAYSEGVSDPSNVGSQALIDTRDQYEYDWNNWPAEKGAPFEDCNGDGQYTPADPVAVAQGATCEDLENDIPGRPGADQTMWTVANDLGEGFPGSAASFGAYSSPPIGMEIQYTVWGYSRPPGDPLGNINFIKTDLIYTGLPGSADNAETPRIDSMFTTWWVDPDVGTFSNDFAGTDTSRSLGFAYNAAATDSDFQQEGLPPAAGGWDFLKGPVTADGDTLEQSSFVFFASGSDISDPTLDGGYEGTLQWYNLMRGVQPRPEYPAADPFLTPSGEPSGGVTLTGDPVQGQGWIDGATLPPGDRRIVNTAGEFSMTKGDTVSVVIGKINAVGTSNITSISRLRFFDTAAQFAFDQDFDVPSPPASPGVQATQLDENVVLNWGKDRELTQRIENYKASPGFDFQGYRVYQLPSRTASLEDGVRIETFDEEDQVRTLVDNVFEQGSGFTVEKPVQSLSNEGVQRYLNIRRDEIRDRPLSNGVDYHFAVTSFGYLSSDENVPSRILESAPSRVTVRPKPPGPGTVDSTVASVGQEVPVSKGNGTGNATITTEIVDPSSVETSNYSIRIEPKATRGGDGSFSVLKGGTPVLSNAAFGTPSDRKSRVVVDGVRIHVSDVTYQAPEFILNSGHTGSGSGLSNGFNGASLFGSLPTDRYPFGPDITVQQAQQDLLFDFTGNGSVGEPTTEGGQIAQYCAASESFSPTVNTDNCNPIRVPFELREVENDRQINVAIFSRNADGNSPWGFSAPPEDGGYFRIKGRDYVVPIHTEYDPQAVRDGSLNPVNAPNSWMFFWLEGSGQEWETGDEFLVEFANPVGPGPVVSEADTWTLSTDSTKTGNNKQASAEVGEIGVFPNPYRGFNKLETSRFDKFVRFTNLPDPKTVGPSTIRIFTLSGNAVRVLEHDQGSPNANFRDWDLRNQGGVPVASGVYLVHINTPVGDKQLKVAIVQEEEILRRY